jgi:hypothetical protein
MLWREERRRGRIYVERASMAAETRKNQDSEGVPVNVWRVARLSNVGISFCFRGNRVV